MRTHNEQISRYLHQWGLQHVPFMDQARQELFETPQTQQARELLDQAAALRTVMLLSGANGVGKSAVVTDWIKRLEPKAYLPLVLTQATLSPSGLLWSLTAELGCTPRLFRSHNLIEIQQALDGLRNVIPIVLLDEAQNYTAATIEEVRMLLGLHLPDQPRFALILLGDDYLLSTFRLQSRRALYSRIAITCELHKLTDQQVTDYLEHHMKQAGLDRESLTSEAIELLSAASEAVPRTLNLLAQAAWIEASRQSHTLIDVAHVQAAIQRVPLARDKVQITSTQSDIR